MQGLEGSLRKRFAAIVPPLAESAQDRGSCSLDGRITGISQRKTRNFTLFSLGDNSPFNYEEYARDLNYAKSS